MKTKIIIGVVTVFLIIITVVLVGIIYTTPEKRISDVVLSKKPPVDLAEMQKRLGPGWKKIEMVKNQWSGPFQMRNGTDWQIAEGEVWVKVDDERSFLDKPGTNPIVSGRQVKFFPATDTAVLFFRY